MDRKDTKTEKLKTFFREIPDGELVSPERIESETGVKMDRAGKSLLRDVLRSLGRPWEATRDGWRVAGASNALAIMGKRFRIIDIAIEAGASTAKNLMDRCLSAMAPEEQRTLIMQNGLFGAFRALANQNPPVLKR